MLGRKRRCCERGGCDAVDLYSKGVCVWTFGAISDVCRAGGIHSISSWKVKISGSTSIYFIFIWK